MEAETTVCVSCTAEKQNKDTDKKKPHPYEEIENNLEISPISRNRKKLVHKILLLRSFFITMTNAVKQTNEKQNLNTEIERGSYKLAD